MDRQQQRAQRVDREDNTPERDQIEPKTTDEEPDSPDASSELAFPDEWGKNVPERGHGDDVG